MHRPDFSFGLISYKKTPLENNISQRRFLFLYLFLEIFISDSSK